MSKTMKKLLSMLLCLAMVMTSLGIAAFADEETDTAEETAAKTTSSYDSDTYYDQALTLCSALGIITGYEDGSVKPESTVTRAEMAAIVLRMLNATNTEKYANSFNDVTSAHWAADTIQTAAGLKIINGMGDGSFLPDGNVLYEQVEKMIVCALGYETDAQLSGGYPTGYQQTANSLKLTDHAPGAAGIAAERGIVIKMVYNALLTKYNQISGTDASGNLTYTAEDTLAKVKFNVIDEKGVLTATSKTSIDAGLNNLNDNEIAIDGDVYETSLKDLEDYIGQKITYFYVETRTSDPVIIAVTSATSKSEAIELDVDDIKSMRDFDKSTGVIEMERGAGSDKRCKDAIIIYNGQVITEDDYTSAAKSNPERFYERDYAGNATSTDVMDFSDFLLPKVGTVKITDSDNDGYYDIVSINSYDTLLVTSVSSKKLTGKINNQTTVFDIDTEENEDLEITVSKGGIAARPRNLSKNDVVSIKRSLDNLTLDMVTTGESVVGTASAQSVVGDVQYAVIGGEEYEIDANAVADLKTGTSSTFYLDAFGRVGYIESSASGKTSGSEKYGWLMSGYISDDGDDYMIRVYTQDGSAQPYKLANKVDYWAYDATSPTTLSGSNRSKIINIVDDENFLVASNYQMRLCRIRTNANGEVNKLYMATDVSKTGLDSDAVTVYNEDLYRKSSTGNAIGGTGYKVQDGMIGFSVPENATDMRSASEYSTYTANASSYKNTESGVSWHYFLCEFDDQKNASVVVRYVSGSNVAYDSGDYGTASDNPVIIVKSVDTAIDDDDEPIYIINGIRSGSAVSYTTNTNSVLSKLSSSSVFSSKDRYNTTDIWTAQSGADLTNYLKPGDIIGVSGGSNANIMIKMVDMDDLVSNAVDGAAVQFEGFGSASDTRDGIGIGRLVEEPDDDGYFTYAASNSWFFASGLAIDLIEITTRANGSYTVDITEDTVEPSEMMAFDDSEVYGDFVFFRKFKNNAQREAIVIRFND